MRSYIALVVALSLLGLSSANCEGEFGILSDALLGDKTKAKTKNKKVTFTKTDTSAKIGTGTSTKETSLKTKTRITYAKLNSDKKDVSFELDQCNAGTHEITFYYSRKKMSNKHAFLTLRVGSGSGIGASIVDIPVNFPTTKNFKTFDEVSMNVTLPAGSSVITLVGPKKKGIHLEGMWMYRPFVPTSLPTQAQSAMPTSTPSAMPTTKSSRPPSTKTTKTTKTQSPTPPLR